METLNLMQGNIYHEFNNDSGHAIHNMYINELGQLRNFWGYEETGPSSLSPSTYNARLITNDGLNLLIADNSGVIVLQYDQTARNFVQLIDKLLFQEARKPEYAPTVPWNPNPNGYSFIQGANGIIYVTDGSVGGLYLLWIPYDSNKQVIASQIYFQQFPYIQVSDNTVDSSVNIKPIQNGEIVALVNPAQLEYLDTHIICVDDASGQMYVIDNVLLKNPYDPNDPFNVSGDAISPATTVSYGFSIQSSPCPITAVKRINKTLYVIGSKSIEQWYSASDNRPIQRYQDRSVEMGTTLRKTIVNFNGRLIFLASSNDKMWGVYIWDATQSQATFVNKNNINYIFDNMQSFDKITFTAFGMHSQEFLLINFNEPNPEHHYSLLLNISSHDSFYVVDQYRGNPSRFLADDIFRFQNEYYFISWNINKLYRFSERLRTYEDREIKCLIRTTQFYSFKNRKLALKNLLIGFHPIPEQYYSYYDKNCLPTLQDNQITTFKISHKNYYGQWIEEKTFRKLNRRSFHALKAAKIVTNFNPQIIITFYQSTYLELGEIIYLPILLNFVTLETEELL